jgi:hypothetical protein
MLSSGNSECIDGPAVHECSGTFASDGWHGVGVALIIVGVIMVGAAVAKSVAARRESGALNRR